MIQFAASETGRLDKYVNLQDLKDILPQVQKHVTELPKEKVLPPEPELRQTLSLTHEDVEIKDCLWMLKRACQINYICFDRIENFIFGDQYRPEVRIEMGKLSNIISYLLGMDQKQADTFATYLVNLGQQKTDVPIHTTTKVLQCRVVTLLIQNLNSYCNGVIVYNQTK